MKAPVLLDNKLYFYTRFIKAKVPYYIKNNSTAKLATAWNDTDETVFKTYGTNGNQFLIDPTTSTSKYSLFYKYEVTTPFTIPTSGVKVDKGRTGRMPIMNMTINPTSGISFNAKDLALVQADTGTQNPTLLNALYDVTFTYNSAAEFIIDMFTNRKFSEFGDFSNIISSSAYESIDEGSVLYFCSAIVSSETTRDTLKNLGFNFDLFRFITSDPINDPSMSYSMALDIETWLDLWVQDIYGDGDEESLSSYRTQFYPDLKDSDIDELISPYS